MRIAIGTVAHPGSAKFHEALGISLRHQTDQDFDVLVLNDSSANLTPLMEGLGTHIRNAAPGCTPSALRKDLISWAHELADALLFIDSDDWCMPERVEVCRAHLNTHEAVAHDLDLVDDEHGSLRMLVGGQIEDGHIVTLSDIADSNFLGLSNTGGRTEALQHASTEVPDQIIAFDWALYTTLIANGTRMVYDARPLSSYRQHENNVANLMKCDAASMLRAVEIKAAHYALFCQLSPWYEKRAKDFALLVHRLEGNEDFSAKYLAWARGIARSNALWWENAPPYKKMVK